MHLLNLFTAWRIVANPRLEHSEVKIRSDRGLSIAKIRFEQRELPKSPHDSDCSGDWLYKPLAYADRMLSTDKSGSLPFCLLCGRSDWKLNLPRPLDYDLGITSPWVSACHRIYRFQSLHQKYERYWAQVQRQYRSCYLFQCGPEVRDPFAKHRKRVARWCHSESGRCWSAHWKLPSNELATGGLPSNLPRVRRLEQPVSIGLPCAAASKRLR